MARVRPAPGPPAGVLEAGPDPATRTGGGRWRRVGAYALTVFLLVTVNFFLPRALPGDPVDALVDAGSPSHIQDEALRADLEEYYGLDRPLIEQYGRHLADLARGEFGTSIRHNAPVADLMRERLPWTLLLVATAISLAVVVGWLAGIHSGWRRGRPADRGLLTLFLGVHSFPVFFLGSITLFALSVRLGWFPLAGARTPFLEDAGFVARVADVAHHLALPGAVLAANFVASQYLNMRASMVGQLGADHLVVGRAKGLPERWIKYRYAARNALLPAVTLTAVHVSFAVTQAILVETVFAYQGVGRLMFEAVAFRDYPTLQACFLVLSILVVTANFMADALYGRLDPRTAAE
jgi:peptide/nickel transport system permease protein